MQPSLTCYCLYTVAFQHVSLLYIDYCDKIITCI